MELEKNEVFEMSENTPAVVSPTKSKKSASISEDAPVIISASPSSKVSLDMEMVDSPELITLSPVQEEAISGVMEVCHGENTLMFHNVSYRVSGVSKCSWNSKVILDRVSGVMLPGINAIMGPTGGGKTTLLDILAQRKGSSGIFQGVGGKVLFNGQPLPPDYHLTTGYVVQDDILEGILTVSENIHFSAALRLPASTTRKQRAEKVDSIITQLGLGKAADTVVGTEFIRGISGGERRRTVIGMELIIDPQILFMDEPTTGLDAHTAVSVMQSLQDWCLEHNRLVILSIHQPRYSIYKLFDTLTLLSLGSIVYQGRAAGAVPYFSQLGYGLEERENPADFFLDILSDSQSAIAIKRRTIRKIRPKQKLDLISEFTKSEEKANQDKLLASIEAVEVKSKLPRRAAQGVARTCRNLPINTYRFFWQVLVLAIRSTITNFRNPGTMLFQVVVMSCIAIVVGVIYFQLQAIEYTIRDNYISDRIGAFFLIMLTQEFGVLTGFDLFISQRALFIHENGNGFYKVSSYFVSKIITNVIPLRIIPLIFFSIIIYFMIGFQYAADKFFVFFWILALAAIALSSIAFAISAAIKNRSIAIVVFSLVNLTSVLFSGVVISLSTLPAFLEWAQYLSVYNYGVQSLALNEIAGTFYNTTRNTTDPDFVCSVFDGCLNGTEALEQNSFRVDTEFLWISTGALIGISVVLWTITYILLRCAKKTK